jgi:hypothetical protein
MQTETNKSIKVPAWLLKFGFCFLTGIIYEIAVFYSSGLIPEEHNTKWLVGAGATLWVACAWIGWRRAPFAELVAAVVGLVWGLMITFPVLVGTEDTKLVINWPKLMVGFLVVPLLVLITVLPFWFMGKKPAGSDAPNL